MSFWWIIGAVAFFAVLQLLASNGPKKEYKPPVMVMGDDGQWHCLNPKECREDDDHSETNPHAI